MSIPAVPSPAIPPLARRYLPWLVAVSLFMENLDATILNTAVPTMSANLGVEPLSLKSVLTSYTLSLAVFIPVSGWMSDRIGTKRLFGLAIALFMLGSLLCGLAVNVPSLVAARIVQGIGGAMMTPVARLALVRTFARSEMLTVMNYVLIPALIAPLLGPFVGGLIVHWLHWRVIFFLNIPFGFVGLWMVRRYMPDYRDDKAAPLDRAGFLLFGTGIALLSYVLEVFGEHRLPLSAIGVMLIGATALLAAYTWHAGKAKAPLLDLRLLGIRTFRLSILGGIVTRLGMGGMPFLLPLLYQIGLGFEAWQAGLLTMPQALAAIGTKFFNKPLLARFGHRRVLMVNTALLGMGIMVFTQVGPGTPTVAILGLSLVQGLLSSIQFTSMNSLIYADVTDKDASRASSIASTGQQLSLSFGVAVASLLAGWFLGNVNQTDPTQAIPALHKAFFAMGSITVLSSFTFWWLQPNDGNNVSNRQLTPKKQVAELTPG